MVADAHNVEPDPNGEGHGEGGVSLYEYEIAISGMMYNVELVLWRLMQDLKMGRRSRRVRVRSSMNTEKTSVC